MILENVACVAKKVIVDRLDWLETMAQEENPDPSVQLVHQAIKVTQDFQDCQACEVPSGPLDHLAIWEWLDQLVKVE